MKGRGAKFFVMAVMLSFLFVSAPLPAFADHGPLSKAGDVVGRAVGGAVGAVVGGVTLVATTGDMDATETVFHDTYRGVGGLVGWVISTPERFGEFLWDAFGKMSRGEGCNDCPIERPEHPGL